jgi:hypothetical protein
MPNIQPEYAALIVLVGVGFLLQLVSSIVSIFKSFRRDPPMDQELYQFFVRKEELAAVKDQLNKDLSACESRSRTEVTEFKERYERTVGALFEALRNTTSAFQTGFGDLTRSIGKLEGKIETHLADDKRSS